ncbi:MAG: metallophosphoesterase [Clostridia bacterium]|nr:metallophosphoesterase [Clostridia bacterium]
MKEKRKDCFFLRIGTLISNLVLATLAATAFRAMRNHWVFYDPNTFFLGGSTGIFIIALVTIAVSLCLLVLRLYKPELKGKELQDYKFLRILGVIAFVLSLLLAVGICVIILCSDAEFFLMFLDVLKGDLPLVIIFAVVAIFLLALPKLRPKAKAIVAVCMAAIMGLWALWMVFPLKPYSFASDPVVMDTGEEYAVVFATNDKGTGYVQYSFGGKDYTVYAEQQGRRISNRIIHSIRVPYEHLKNNAYSVGSTQVFGDYAYGSRLGKSIEAGPYTLKVNEGETQRYLCISDWHSQIKKAKGAIAQLGEYDGVIMLGDPNTGLNIEEQAVRYIVQFGGDITGGAMPVIYVRGNHETRGAFAADLPEYLGFESFYYTVARGAYSFVVLDSGEDKPDDHVEYGGLDEYARHRADMLEWLQTKPQTTDKLIVLSHDWLVSKPEPEVSRVAWDTLQQMGARFMVSGHKHVCEFLEDDTEDEAAPTYLKAYPGISTYIDGGYANQKFVASKLTVTAQGVRFEAADNTGEKVMDKTLPWQQ